MKSWFEKKPRSLKFFKNLKPQFEVFFNYVHVVIQIKVNFILELTYKRDF